MQFQNIYSLFRARVDQYRAREGQDQRNAFYYREAGEWQGFSWERFEDETYDFAFALLSKGLSRRASVCVLMGNVPEWPVADIGTVIAGGVGVGLYPTSSPEQCEYIINHSDAEFVLVDSSAQLEKILSIRERLTNVKKIIALNGSAIDAQIVSYRQFLAQGREERERCPDRVAEIARAAQPGDTAIMVYTSGTTGLPKGACLSHRYIINSAESLRGSVPVYTEDTAFSYLPFCHVAERISGLYNRLYAGATAYFVDDISKLWQYMLEVKPTVFASLPRFFEKVHARVMADVEQLPDKERAEFQSALDKGRTISQLRRSGHPVAQDLQADYDRTAVPVLKRVKDYFGGRIRIATSGGAPLPSEIAEFFAAADLPILQAYGLTENICVAFNRPDHYKFGTVGPAMPGCEIRIADDGEILVKSEMMFSGYYKEPEKTAEVMRNGWLLTGDLGELDSAGFLKITGRKKELIVTSTGKKIPPSYVENLVKEHHLISHAFVFGEGKSYLVALITLNAVEAQEFARRLNITGTSYTELTRDPGIRALVREQIERVNQRVSSTEAIRKFHLLDRDFQIEAGEVTPTLKVRRDVVTERYSDLLESLYRNDEGAIDE